MLLIKKIIIINFLNIFIQTNLYAQITTWICQSERFGNFIWEYDDNFIYQKFPADDVRKFKITKDHRKSGLSIYGTSKGSIFDLDAYMDFQDMYVKVRQVDREFGFSGEYTDTNCKTY